MSKNIKLPNYTRVPSEVDSPDALVKALKQAHDHTRDKRKQEVVDTPKSPVRNPKTA